MKVRIRQDIDCMTGAINPNAFFIEYHNDKGEIVLVNIANKIELIGPFSGDIKVKGAVMSLKSERLLKDKYYPTR